MGVRQFLDENNFCFVDNFVSSGDSDRLNTAFVNAERNGELRQDDPQVPGSSSIYNFLPFLKLLVKKIPHISELVEEDVFPTYCYARIYKHGAVLSPHIDRHACEISATLNIAQSHDWPIFIRKPSGEVVSINIKPGQAMLYKGRVAEHWREAFNGENYSQVFLHYVLADGDCAFSYFDKARAQ